MLHANQGNSRAAALRPWEHKPKLGRSKTERKLFFRCTCIAVNTVLDAEEILDRHCDSEENSISLHSKCSAGICKYKTLKEWEEEKEERGREKMERERETQQTEVTLVKLEVWRRKTWSCLKAAFWTAVLKPINVLLNSFYSGTACICFLHFINKLSGKLLSKYIT